MHFSISCGQQDRSLDLFDWMGITSQTTNSHLIRWHHGVWERLILTKRNLGTLESVVADRLICHCSSGDLTSFYVKRKDWTNMSPSVFCGT
jgi:hypothetical protein